MKYIVLVSMFLISGCGVSAMSEQLKRNQDAINFQECKRTTKEMPLEDGGTLVEETRSCRQWRK